MQILRVILLLVNLVASIAFVYAALRARDHTPMAFMVAAGFVVNFAYILTAPPGRLQ